MTTSEQLIEDQKVIDKLESEELDLLKQLNEKREILRKLKTDHWLKERNLHIGDAVAFKDGTGISEKIYEGKLVGFEYYGTNPGMPLVMLFNKSGDVGKTKKRVYRGHTILKI